MGPFAWEHRPVKRLRSSAQLQTQPNPREPETVCRHLPLETDEKHTDAKPNVVMSLLGSHVWEDLYLRHPDLSSLPRSQNVFRQIEIDPRLSMRLPVPGVTAGRVLDHATRTFEELLSKNKPMTFKFGITHDAAVRGYNTTFGYEYSRDIFDYMLVIYAASNPHGPAFLEAALIDRFGGFLFACVQQFLFLHFQICPFVLQ